MLRQENKQVPGTRKKGHRFWLVRGFVGDEILSSSMGIVRNYLLRIPSLSNQDSMESKSFVCFFFRG